MSRAPSSSGASRAPVYLVLGPDFGRREETIQTIRSSLEQSLSAKGRALETRSYYAESLLPSELLTQLYNGMLFSDHILIIYRDVDALRGRDAHALLAKYVTNPRRDATLILVSEKTSLATSWAKRVPKGAAIVCWQPFESEINARVRAIFATHKKHASEEVIGYVSSACGQDSQLASQLARQLVYFFRDKEEITADLLHTFIGSHSDVSLFQLIDALFARNLQGALRFLARLHDEGVKPAQIASMVNNYTQKLWRIIYQHNGGLSLDEALKSEGIVWKMQSRSFRAAAARFRLGELSRILTHNRALEREMRTLGAHYGELLLTLLALHICEAPLLPLPRAQEIA